jgi:glutamate-1-semialdehyde 2,1-aminomutase
MSYERRLNAVIPGGAHTYSRGSDQFPSNAPQALERGEGIWVWDPDGRRFLDYGMALRAVTLGYAYPSVAEAAYRAILQGNNLTRPSLTELEAAELIVDLIPGADMVKFAKNGSNVTSAAAKVARAYTGRKYICVPRQHPFFSFDDWFIGVTPVTRGIPEEHATLTLLFDYGDVASLERLFAEHRGDIAGVMLEPATTRTPCPPGCTGTYTWDAPCRSCSGTGGNFLHAVQRLCRAEGALFILDEMITGFRWHLRGAQHYFGVDPDLSTFGKGMANGFSVAAMVGRREIMEVGGIDKPGAERTFLLSTTHGAEMSGLAAFIETVRIYQEQDVCRHLWEYGDKLKRGLESAAADAGIAAHFALEGPAISLNFVTRDTTGAPSAAFRTLFAQEMIRHGVLMPWIAVSLSHDDAALEATLSAVRKALAVYAQALDGGAERFLEGPTVRPVFRKFN